jgi:alpha-tubulin suppressor-like RCC1 family protein
MAALLELPLELTAHIFAELSLNDLGRLDGVCTALRGSQSIEQALRIRAARAGRAVPRSRADPLQPWTQTLLWEERAAARIAAPIAAGSYHWLACDSAGELHVCGSEEEEDCAGQIHFCVPGLLGLGDLGGGRHAREWAPVPVPALAGVRIASLSAAAEHNLACSAEGLAFSWGSGRNGRLGHGDCSARLVPTRIDALSSESIVMASAGSCHSLFLSESGVVRACGAGWWGRLGLGDTLERAVPERVHIRLVTPQGAAEQPVAHIDAGGDHSLAVSRTGDVFAWGHGQLGQLGLGSRLEPQLRAQRVEALRVRATAVSAGGAHSLILASDGRVFACGDGREGRLGLGDSVGRSIPQPMCGVRDAIAVSAGFDHSLVVKVDGSMSSAGRGVIGALGHGTRGHQPIATDLLALNCARVLHVAAGTGLSLAVAEYGREAPSLYAWGIGGTEHALAVQQGSNEQLLPQKVSGFACARRAHSSRWIARGLL